MFNFRNELEEHLKKHDTVKVTESFVTISTMGRTAHSKKMGVGINTK